LNPRTPARQAPQACAFDLAWQPPQGIECLNKHRAMCGTFYLFGSRQTSFMTAAFAVCQSPVCWLINVSIQEKRDFRYGIGWPRGQAVPDYFVAAAYHSKGGSGLSRLFFSSSFLLCFISFRLCPPPLRSWCLNAKKAGEVCRNPVCQLRQDAGLVLSPNMSDCAASTARILRSEMEPPAGIGPATFRCFGLQVIVSLRSLRGGRYSH
jgi:hypothetical protein